MKCKWRGMWILVLMFVLFAVQAVADSKHGYAIIDAPSGKLHLREEASSSSRSLGLFFNGLEVSLESDVEDGWVYVQIGYIYGYMNARYLKSGAAGERVKDQFWAGTVQATNYARMRYGPSTEYQFACNVKDGANVTIMGESVENWYYVKYKDEEGFISANLVYTRGSFDDDEEYEEEYDEEYEEEDWPVHTAPPVRPVPVQGWRQAYRSYVHSKADSGDTFALIYVNDDDIPELVIDSGVEAEGCKILTYSNGQLSVMTTRRLGFTYIERGNRLCNSDGSQDSYFDDVYEIRNGRWALVARGEYYGYLSGWNDIIQRYVCHYYIWNGKQTTIDQYLIGLSSVYDSYRAVGVEEGYSYSSILNQLEKGIY